MLKNKKGIALSQAFGAVLTLVLVAVLVIVGILVFVNLVSGPFSNISSISVTGESLTPIDAGVLVSNGSLCGFGSFSLVTATNSAGNLMSAGNYTTTVAGLVSNTTALTGDSAAPWILNYTGKWGSDACTASQAMVTQFATYPTLIGLVGTIIFLGLVIGVLVASFVFGKKEGI